MPVVNGVKMACENCIRGHRSAVCPHTYRQLFEVRSRGRPKGCTIDKSTGKWTKPTAKQPRKSRCCGEDKCKCLVVDDDVIEKRDCDACGPGLAQRPLTTPVDLAADVAAAAAEAPSPAHSFYVEFDCTCQGACSCLGCNKHGKSQEPEAPASCCSSRSKAKSKTPPQQPPRPATEECCTSCLPCVIAPFDRPGAIPAASSSSEPAPTPPMDLATFHRTHIDDPERRSWFRAQMEQEKSSGSGSSSVSDSLRSTSDGTLDPVRRPRPPANAEVPWGERLPGELDHQWQKRMGFNYLTPDSVRIFDTAREFREERQRVREQEEQVEEEEEVERQSQQQQDQQRAKRAQATVDSQAQDEAELDELRRRALSGRRKKPRVDGGPAVAAPMTTSSY